MAFTQRSSNQIAPVQKDVTDLIVSGNPVHTSWLHFPRVMTLFCQINGKAPQLCLKGQ